MKQKRFAGVLKDRVYWAKVGCAHLYTAHANTRLATKRGLSDEGYATRLAIEHRGRDQA